jgi:2,2-dialkylglycine decarboxylase (pyruvate)
MGGELERSAKENLIRYGGDTFSEIVASAKGCHITTVSGRKILDFTSGQMCATIGHNHPAIVSAIQQSAETAIHLFSGMIPESVAKLASEIRRIMPEPLTRSMFLSTGSESNEAALKMAKLVTGGFEVVALGGSWHGITGGAGSVS